MLALGGVDILTSQRLRLGTAAAPPGLRGVGRQGAQPTAAYGLHKTAGHR